MLRSGNGATGRNRYQQLLGNSWHLAVAYAVMVVALSCAEALDFWHWSSGFQL